MIEKTRCSGSDEGCTDVEYSHSVIRAPSTRWGKGIPQMIRQRINGSRIDSIFSFRICLSLHENKVGTANGPTITLIINSVRDAAASLREKHIKYRFGRPVVNPSLQLFYNRSTILSRDLCWALPVINDLSYFLTIPQARLREKEIYSYSAKESYATL